jgi:hypothetical protein
MSSAKKTNPKKKSYIRMTHKELITMLNSRKNSDGSFMYDEAYVRSITEKLKEQRAELREKKKIKGEFHSEWEKVIEPLLREQATIASRVSVMRKKIAATDSLREQEKLDVYEPYARSLKDTLGLLRTYQAGKLLPVDAYLHHHTPPATTPTPAWGLSWVDWVDDSTKAELRQAHAAIRDPSARSMAPLFQRVPDRVNRIKRQHDEVRQAWTAELNALLNAIDTSLPNTRQLEEAQAAMIQLALTKVEGKPFTEKLHPSWNRYISADERAAAMREADPAWQDRPSNQIVEQPELPAGAYWDEATPTPAPQATPTPAPTHTPTEWDDELPF